MGRRNVLLQGAFGVLAVFAVPGAVVHAQGLAGISDALASKGLKEALDRGAGAAATKLGAPDGFLGNPKVRIPLPGYLEDVSKIARTLGMGRQLDELVVSMNRAAEAAVPQARAMLVDAVRHMSVTDARNILTGGENSVTDFFRSKTRAGLHEQFLPIVTKTTDTVGLARKYNDLLAKLPVKGKAPRIEEHVTEKALDGLYYMIAQEESAIRRDPIGYGGDAIRKVFGALK